MKEGLRYHYFNGIRGGNLLAFGRLPLDNGTGGWGGDVSATSFRISSSSMEEILRISGHEANMDVKKKIHGEESNNGEEGNESENGDES
jgi:hypothetical protein